MANIINSDPIKELVKKLQKGIIKLQNPNGWYPFAISNEGSITGIWATGQAVAALNQIDATSYSKEIHSAISWLESHQREDGGWGVMLREASSVESTAWIIMGLSNFESEYHEPLIKAVKWLKTNQNDDGGWGSWKGDASRVNPISFSMMALSSVERDRSTQQRLNMAIKWLKTHQNDDGGWSFGLDDQSNVLATSYALIALLNNGGNRRNEHVQNAVEFLRQHQHKEGFFGENPFIVETIARETGITRWQHFTTSPSILALSLSGGIDTTLYKGIKWLIDYQIENFLTPSALSFTYHAYVTLYCIAKASHLIETTRFKVYSDMITELERDESEAQFLAKKRRLKRLIVENALLLGDFELASGKKSNYYFDMKRITQDPEASEIIADIFLYLMKNKNINSVGGLEIGAIPLATAISMRSHHTKTPLTAFFVRDQRKNHGTGRRIDGILKKYSNVIIVDDVTTTGKSILTAISEVEKEGCNIKGVFTIIDRCEGGKEALLEKGYDLKSIFDISEFKYIISPRDESNNRKVLES